MIFAIVVVVPPVGTSGSLAAPSTWIELEGIMKNRQLML